SGWPARSGARVFPCRSRVAQLVDNGRKVRGQRRADTEISARGPLEAHARGVQKHSPQVHRGFQLFVESFVAVLVIAGDRVSRVLRVDTDLVGAARLDRDLHQSRALPEKLDRPELADGG